MAFVKLKFTLRCVLKCEKFGSNFLNHVHAGHRLTRAWFLKIVSVRTSVCVFVRVCDCVCPPLRLLITSGMIWTLYDWLNKFYGCYMATVAIIVNGHGLGIGTRRRH